MQTVKQLFILIVLFGFALGNSNVAFAAPGDQKVYYYLHDHLGGIQAVTDEQGQVVEWRDYLPYGEDRLEEGDLPAEASVTNYGFTGKEQDPETELYYYGARYYDPMTGRFISLDPWEGDLTNPQTLNKYNYALNNPLLYIDLWGLFNSKTDTVEKGDNLTDITQILNEKYGTNYTIEKHAKLNNIPDADKIYPGQRITTGTIDSEGNVWQPPTDIASMTEESWDQLSPVQKYLTTLYRNAFAKEFSQPDQSFENYGETATHNLNGASGNEDYRGTGSNLGQQIIVDKDGNQVNTPENMGTFDYSPPSKSIRLHLKMDVLPWIAWGNSRQDTTSRTERLKAAIKTIINNIRK